LEADPQNKFDAVAALVGIIKGVVSYHKGLNGMNTFNEVISQRFLYLLW
jgi:hypothetical protein